MITDLQKWIHTAKIIIRKAASQKTSHNLRTYTKIAGTLDINSTDPIHYIIKSLPQKILNHRKPTTINKYYNSTPFRKCNSQRLHPNNKQSTKQNEIHQTKLPTTPNNSIVHPITIHFLPYNSTKKQSPNLKHITKNKYKKR